MNPKWIKTKNKEPENGIPVIGKYANKEYSVVTWKAIARDKINDPIIIKWFCFDDLDFVCQSYDEWMLCVQAVKEVEPPIYWMYFGTISEIETNSLNKIKIPLNRFSLMEI